MIPRGAALAIVGVIGAGVGLGYFVGHWPTETAAALGVLFALWLLASIAWGPE